MRASEFDNISEGPMDFVRKVAKAAGSAAQQMSQSSQDRTMSSVQKASVARLNNIIDSLTKGWESYKIALGSKAADPAELKKFLSSELRLTSSQGSSLPDDAPSAIKNAAMLYIQNQTVGTPSSPQQQPAQPAPAVKAAPKYSNPQELVADMLKTIPPQWLPQITQELLKAQTVSSGRKTT